MIVLLKVFTGVVSVVDLEGRSVTEFLSSSSWKQQLDELGNLSGVAQDLKGPITTYEKFLQSDQQAILLFLDPQASLINPTIIGYLKYGFKNLYFYLKNGSIKQHEHALCLLDFFVLDNYQRHGIGKQLFDSFLQVENVTPNKVAYDRPSPKLLPFLHKHYHIINPDHQPNRYTIYDGFL